MSKDLASYNIILYEQFGLAIKPGSFSIVVAKFRVFRLNSSGRNSYHYGRSSHVNSSFEGWLFCFLANYTITIIASVTVVVASLVVAVATCFLGRSLATRLH